MNGIDVLRGWKRGSKPARRLMPPHDLSPWLPWSMSEDRKRAFMTPG